ncbi:MAG: hypothetical protein ACI8S6_001181 [Myxococcota bacterium]|jgi:hypothetical protein
MYVQKTETIIDQRAPEQLAEMSQHAEDVRAYLVNLRGGAPFLSGADSQLLHGWLTDGVPVAVIMASLDRVAMRRRQRRTRGRMSLQSCRGEVRRMMGRARPRPTRRPGSLGGLGRLAEQIGGLSMAPLLVPLRETLAGELLRLDAEGPADIEERARQAIAVCRRFHEGVWDAIIEQRQALLADAETELDSLRGLLRGTAWIAAVEEVARDRIRARFPLVSAQVIWDRLHEGPARAAS